MVNGDGVEHDVVFPDFKAATDKVNRKGASSVTVFRVGQSGEFVYFCSLPGHRQAGMEGKIVVWRQDDRGGAAPGGERCPRSRGPAGAAAGRWRCRAATSSWITHCHGWSGAWLASWWSTGPPTLTSFTVMVPRA
jgi:hypothetical protein